MARFCRAPNTITRRLLLPLFCLLLTAGAGCSRKSAADAYRDYVHAAREGDLEKVKAYLAPSVLQDAQDRDISDEQLLEIVQGMVKLLPKEMKIKTRDVRANRTWLAVESPDGLSYGLIFMEKGLGGWRIKGERWTHPRLQASTLADDVSQHGE